MDGHNGLNRTEFGFWGNCSRYSSPILQSIAKPDSVSISVLIPPGNSLTKRTELIKNGSTVAIAIAPFGFTAVFFAARSHHAHT